MYGLKDPCNHKHYEKATSFLTNSKHVAEGMGRRCSGQHEHQQLHGQVKVAGKWCNRTRIAQVYPVLEKRQRERERERDREREREKREREERERREREREKREREREKRARESEVLEELTVEDERRLEQSVRRCHVNLCHPSRERFLHIEAS